MSKLYTKVNGHVYFHPGFYIEEYRCEMRLSTKDMAKKMQVPEEQLEKIINGTSMLSEETEQKLAKFFGTSVAMWRNINDTYINGIGGKLNA